MPTITEKPVTAYAHCRDARCDGYSQTEVEAFEILTTRSYIENGGDIPGDENSWVTWRFANDEDVPCPSCGHYREVQGQRRPTYQALSGHSQTSLLGAPKFDANKMNTERDAEIAELKARLEEQSAKVDALLDALGEQHSE